MPLTEEDRQQILRWFEEAMGPELGTKMIGAIPPRGWDDLATKADLAALEQRLDARIDGVVVTLRAEMSELRSELRGEIGGLRGELGSLRGDLAKTFVTWLLLSQAAMISVVALLVG